MAEHGALKRCADTLTDLLQHQVVTISTSLLAKGLLNDDLHSWVLTAQGVSNKEKAARILASVMEQVKARTQSYGLFVEVLEGDAFYEDAVKKLSSEYRGLITAELDSGVADNIDKLESRFRAIHKNILSELDSKKTPVRGLLDSLTMLPVKLKQEYGQSISEKLPDLCREEEASDLFLYHLNDLVNFIDYHLVKYIIEEFGSNTLKVEIHSYAADLLVFMKETTIKEFMGHCKWFGEEAKSHKLSKLITKINGNPATYTLYDLDQLRRRFCAGVKMTEVVFVLIGLDSANSFLALWAVPTLLVPQLIEAVKALDFGFYLRLGILKVTVDDRQIFPFLPDSKSKVPALQAEATTAVRAPQDLMDVKETVQTFSHLFLLGVQETGQAMMIKHFSSSVEYRSRDKHLSMLSTRQQSSADEVRDQLKDCALYKGVTVELFQKTIHLSLHLESTFKRISLAHTDEFEDFKHLITAVAQYRGYPETSPPFVIAVFVRGHTGLFAKDTIITSFGLVDIVDDIIKPFLPQSAPHLISIPKLFFISSEPLSESRQLQDNIKLPLLPDDPNSNYMYCVAYNYCAPLYTERWFRYITEHLLSGSSVEEVVEQSRYIASGHLHYFSRLKNKQLTLSE